MGIYVGYDSPTIIKYFEPTMGVIFEARYTDYFKTRRKKNNKPGKRMVKEIEWNQPSMSWQDP